MEKAIGMLKEMPKAKFDQSVELAIQLGIDALSISFDPDWKAYFEAQMKAKNE